MIFILFSFVTFVFFSRSPFCILSRVVELWARRLEAVIDHSWTLFPIWNNSPYGWTFDRIYTGLY